MSNDEETNINSMTNEQKWTKTQTHQKDIVSEFIDIEMGQ